ncbi:MAG: chitobiase/beta-hexosaminidase C-terminal domain-containing protein [Chloroflexota bacterium]
MTKIREIIQINSGYTSYVDLYEEYYDIVKNRGRMERYKPISAHRQAFEKIANALNPLDRRFYFLSGSYGTGKSHLLLMLANYFANPSDVPEIEKFFENYEAAQNEVLRPPGEVLNERSAQSLKEARKSGRFLVAVCRYSLNLDFEGTLLRALEDALKHDETEIPVESHYREALRRIKDWESRRNETRFFSDLQAAISRLFPDWTIHDLIDGLEKYDEQALRAFKTCFKEVTDTEFTYDKDNLRDIISDFLQSPQFKERYKGIVFLYDEFGAAIDANLVNYTTLLDFAQYCANSTLEKGGTVIFIGSGHKAFRNHGQIGDLNAETLEARVTEIGLQTTGMEDIIAAIVQPKKDLAEWKQLVEPHAGKFTWFSGECNRLKLFNWLPAPKIKNNIIQNIYPMHPLATYTLLRLAGEAGSDNRSVFKFFAPEFDTGEGGWSNVQPYSYPWFIENHEIVEQNKLVLYTADLLVDYFQDSLKATNNRLADRVKNAVINYEATLRELNAYVARQNEQLLFDAVDDLMLRIIKVILVNEIASTQDINIANTAQNIEFALDYVSPEEKGQVESRLKRLCDAGVLFNNQGVYELVRGNRRDVRRLVEQYKANPDNRPTNLLDLFLSFNPLSGDDIYLEAKDYNAEFSEDKRLKVIFATPTMLIEEHPVDSAPMSFFEKLEKERESITNRTSAYEGVAVYVFCENDQDIDIAKKAASRKNQPRVVVAVPRNPISVYDAIFTLKALESEWFKKQSQNFDPYEKAEEKKLRDEALKVLENAKTAYFSNSKVYWFASEGKEIPVQENKRHDIANWMIRDLYKNRRNTFGHNEFNKCHINLTGQVRAIFKEAGDILCDLSKPISVNWSWPDNRGGTKYLRRCFVDHQALRVLSVEGDIRYLEAEKDIDKFRKFLPAYAHLLESLAALESKGEVNFNQFIAPYFKEFGQGEIAVTLMLLLARRFYGDGLRFKREPNNLTDIQFTSTDDMLELVQGKYPSAVILFEPVSAEEQMYFAKVTQIFTSQPVPAGKTYTISEAYQAATTWWDHLPNLARALVFYPEKTKPLAEAFSKAKTRDPFIFIKHELLELLGQEPGVTLTSSSLTQMEGLLKDFKSTAEAIQTNVEEEILKKVAEVFGSPSHLDVDIQEAFRNWYNGLSSAQKDPLGIYHNNDSKPLIKFTTYTNIRELLFKTLPEAYGLGKVETWTSNYVETYIERIRRGKLHIETNAPSVSQLKLEFKNHLSQKDNQVTYQGQLILHADTEDGQGIIYYTVDGSDPTNSPQRQKLTPGDTLTIQGNRKVKLVVADERGNYTTVKTIEAIDELEKHKIVRPPQKNVLGETITFVFPTNKEAARITLHSLLSELAKSGLYHQGELRQEIQRILDDLKE